MAYRNPDTGLARGREGFRRRTAERRAQNLCPKCGKAPPESDRRLCELCAEKRRKAERARDAKRRALGQKRYTNPEKERARNRKRYQQQTAERLAQGLCPKCGKEELPPGRRLCESCGGKRRKAERARYLKAKAAGKVYGKSRLLDFRDNPELGIITGPLIVGKRSRCAWRSHGCLLRKLKS